MHDMVEHGTEYAVGCAETHLSDVKHMEAVRSLAKDGWKASGAPAWASARSETLQRKLHTITYNQRIGNQHRRRADNALR